MGEYPIIGLAEASSARASTFQVSLKNGISSKGDGSQAMCHKIPACSYIKK